jgi:sulfite reductase (NADPH) hemoprotein beta-component
MLRVAVPYGLLSSAQVRKLAHIARTYDKGYAHITTRQNVQFNWPELKVVPEILAELATVQMHAIQTSGACIRNITSDPFAGVAADEYLDPRPWCEILRQWSTFHPEFAFLPRKFKIAVNGAAEDRAVIQCHDIGLELKRDAAGEIGFRVLVGGGMGRTPIIGEEINAFVPWQHIITYCEAILRVQPLRPPRQPLQGAHQDPRQGAGHRRVQAPGRGGMGLRQGRPEHPHRSRTHPRGRPLHDAGLRDPAGR